MKAKMTQELNGAGWIGAFLFVLSPMIGGFLWHTSAAAYARAIMLYGADTSFAKDALYPYPVYAALSCASLIGLVMVIVGRDHTMETLEDQSKVSAPRSNAPEWR